MKQITDHAALSRQENDATLTELWIVEGRKVRVHIRSNSYKFQCHAVAEVWTDVGWREVWTLASGAMETPESLAYRRDDIAAEFDADRSTLLMATEAVLKASPEPEQAIRTEQVIRLKQLQFTLLASDVSTDKEDEALDTAIRILGGKQS